MSSLTDVEKRYLETLLGMGSGWVLDYSDATFGQLFNRFKIDIHAQKYQAYGTSKAKKLRSFWEQEPDALVAPILSELLAAYEAMSDLKGAALDVRLLEKCTAIRDRLGGKSAPQETQTADAFLQAEFQIPNLNKLPVPQAVTSIIEGRLSEARIALAAKAHLSTIFLCGSILEAVLLGAAQQSPRTFNQSPSAPKMRDGSVKQFHDWTLGELIDVACDCRLLKPDIQKFGHGLRDFRNYIHPYQQLVSGFLPDEHTAKVCFQVLKAALASVVGDRK